MKATRLIEKLQNMVNEHGDFDLKVGYTDDEYSYSEYLNPEDCDIDVDWDDRDNHWYGGWLLIDKNSDEEEEEED